MQKRKRKRRRERWSINREGENSQWVRRNKELALPPLQCLSRCVMRRWSTCHRGRAFCSVNRKTNAKSCFWIVKRCSSQSCQLRDKCQPRLISTSPRMLSLSNLKKCWLLISLIKTHIHLTTSCSSLSFLISASSFVGELTMPSNTFQKRLFCSDCHQWTVRWAEERKEIV